MSVEEHTIELAGAPAFYRGAPSAGPAVPVYLHGAPTSSDDWTAALERTGGLAPDLLGFGRSTKGGHLEYSPEALADFVEDLLSELHVDRYQLVLHGWGAAAGVLLAARAPDRVERVVLFNAVPLLPGLAWPWWARMLRVPGAGELTMGSVTKTVLTRWLRSGSTRPTVWAPSPTRRARERAGRRLRRIGRRLRRQAVSPTPATPTRAGRVWDQFDQGTQRAILRLQRSVDEERERAMAVALESLRMPVLVLWGQRDPWSDQTVLDAYSARMPSAHIERLAAAGHWPWLDDPAVLDRVAEFLGVPADH